MKEACSAHALLRYFDQLFWLVYAESSSPRSRSLCLWRPTRWWPGSSARGAAASHSIFRIWLLRSSLRIRRPWPENTLDSIMILLQGQDVEIDRGGLLMETGMFSAWISRLLPVVAAADGKVGRRKWRHSERSCGRSRRPRPSSRLNAAQEFRTTCTACWPAVTARGARPPQMVLDAVELGAARNWETRIFSSTERCFVDCGEDRRSRGRRLLRPSIQDHKDEQKVIDALKGLLGFA